MDIQSPSREAQIRAEFNLEDVVSAIKRTYKGSYDPFSTLDAWDQLLVHEAVSEATPIIEVQEEKKNVESGVSAGANGMVNGTYKRKDDFELTQSRLQVIEKLKHCNYRTFPIEVAQLLEKFFAEWESMPDHWLFIAQHWPVRAIIRVINYMVKRQSQGWITLQNPSAYFREMIKLRKKRKKLL